jgi:hypothetical protein
MIMQSRAASRRNFGPNAVDGSTPAARHAGNSLARGQLCGIAPRAN